MPLKRRGDWRSPELPGPGQLWPYGDGSAPETVYAQVLYQIGALEAIARAEHGVLRHVKPHGMLYNRSERFGAGGGDCPRGAGLQSAADSGWRRVASLFVPENGWG